MPRCFLAKKSLSSTSEPSSSSSIITSSELAACNPKLDSNLPSLAEKWDEAIVKLEIETEDEEGLSSDGNCSNNSGDDHFIPPSRLIHRSSIGSISAAKAVQSIKEPLTAASSVTATTNEPLTVSKRNGTAEEFSHIKKDAQTTTTLPVQLSE